MEQHTFYRLYANVPMPLREKPIIIGDNQVVTLREVYFKVHDTGLDIKEVSPTIIEFLKDSTLSENYG